MRKRGEGLPLQDTTDNILATPRRRSRPYAIYQPSPTKKAKLSALYLPHPDNVGTVPSGMVTAPLMFRARDVPRTAESLPRRTEKGSLVGKIGLDHLNIAAVKAGPMPPPLPERRKHTSHEETSIPTVPHERINSTDHARGLIPPLPPLKSDIKAAVNERFLQVRREEVSQVSGLAGKVSPTLMGNASVGTSGHALVCDSGSSKSGGRSWVTYNTNAKRECQSYYVKSAVLTFLLRSRSRVRPNPRTRHSHFE